MMNRNTQASRQMKENSRFCCWALRWTAPLALRLANDGLWSPAPPPALPASFWANWKLDLGSVVVIKDMASGVVRESQVKAQRQSLGEK